MAQVPGGFVGAVVGVGVLTGVAIGVGVLGQLESQAGIKPLQQALVVQDI